MTILNGPGSNQAPTVGPPTSRLDSPPQRSGWTPGRSIALMVGLLAAVGGVAMLLAGGAVLAIDHAWREDGYLTSDEIPLHADGYAVTSGRVDLEDVEPWWPEPDGLLGKVRLRVSNADPTRPVFIGVTSSDQASEYLAGVRHSTLTEIADPATTYAHSPGGPPRRHPDDGDIWIARASGTGPQEVFWPLRDGSWTVVVMNADASRGVDVVTDIGATVPINRIAGGVLLLLGAVLVAAGAVLVTIPLRRSRRHRAVPATPLSDNTPTPPGGPA